MKKSFILAAFAVLTLAACKNNNKTEENHEHNADGSHPQNTHVHDDGSVHDDHDSDTTVEQVQFKVEQDSISHKQDSTAHVHDHSDPNHKH